MGGKERSYTNFDYFIRDFHEKFYTSRTKYNGIFSFEAPYEDQIKFIKYWYNKPYDLYVNEYLLKNIIKNVDKVLLYSYYEETLKNLINNT